MKVRILKFGGTSVTGAERLSVIEEVVRDRSRRCRPVLVVSAFAGITESLEELASRAARGCHEEELRDLGRRHLEAVEELGCGEDPEVKESVRELHGELDSLLRGVALIGECSPRTRDAILSHGERVSALVVSAALRRQGLPAMAVDARELVVTDEGFGEARVDQEATGEAARARLLPPGDHMPVVTGFIGRAPSGETTTLGRGGSDYTAALLGSALEAEAVEIWTDVSGVMSADPRIVPNAFPLENLSYDELLELSHWGARVVHASAVRPLREHRIPMRILNTLRPRDRGTRVVPSEETDNRGPVRGITSIREVALLRVSGYGFLGGAGTVSRLFGALDRGRAKVLLVSQGSSERSICVAVHPDGLQETRRAVEEEFELERQAGRVEDPVVEEDVSVIAIVGEGMREQPGIAGRFFDVLGAGGINVRAIAQGSSELNISAVVQKADEERALRAVHNAFFHPVPEPARVYLVGVGRVGSALLDQVARRERAESPERLILAGVASTRAFAVSRNGIDPAAWEEAMEPGAGGLEALVEASSVDPGGARIFVDCTAAEAPAEAYEDLLRQGISVVTANKRAGSGPGERHRRLLRAQMGGGHLYAETTVGAGLPVLRPLSDLRDSGDTIRKIEGILSGTLAFLATRLMEGAAFSDAVREAHRKGYTEPDPRDDLTGMDVVRKLVILGRAAGWSLEVEDVEVESLVPDGWLELSVEEFWDTLPELDPGMEERVRAVREGGGRLVYLAELASDRARVGFRAVGPDHPASGLRGTENLVSVTSDRYSDSSLVVRGPGAGPEVTASGLYADLLRARLEMVGRPLPLRQRARPFSGGREPGHRRDDRQGDEGGKAGASR